MNLYGRDFLKLIDYTEEEIIYLIQLAMEFKKKKHAGKKHDYLKGPSKISRLFPHFICLLRVSNLKILLRILRFLHTQR